MQSTSTSAYVQFESGPVRSILLSPDGTQLYWLNTADHRLEIYSAPSMVHRGSVFTGLEPVSMALHPADPGVLFVANHLSDSVSVVNLVDKVVAATIPVGDEPCGLAVIGDELFVAVARARELGGSQTMRDNLIVVAQASFPYAVTDQVVLPAQRPRALKAVGNTLYVIPRDSGNHTTVLPWPHSVDLVGEQTVLDSHDLQHDWVLNEALTDPLFDSYVGGLGLGWSIPEVPRIVFDHEFPALVPQLADNDILAIDATTHALAPTATTGVGTTLFAIERNPLTGELWVACTEAHNRTRMEYNLRGQAFENRVSIAAPGGAVQQIVRLAPPLTSVEHAQPVALAFYSGAAGKFAYVAPLGSDVVVVLDAADPSHLVAEIPVGAMPIGLAVDESRDALYVHTRGNQRVRVYDIAAGHAPTSAVARLPYDPEPLSVRRGREHLYDARAATGHGTGNFSCASCHVFAHHDFLAWDLGNSAGGLGYTFPDLMTGERNPGGIVVDSAVPAVNPMKGPMVTQSLRGVADDPPFHWRGDRRFFPMFRGAYQSLLGGSGIGSAEMQEFAAFLRHLRYPPNPHTPKDRVLTGDARQGAMVFGRIGPGKAYAGDLRCFQCHKSDDEGNATGSQLAVNDDGLEQFLNAGTLRGLYEKDHPELTGFGTSSDGDLVGVRGFMENQDQISGGDAFMFFDENDRDHVAEFLRQWETDYPSLVGEQFTLRADNVAEAAAYLDLAEAQAEAGLLDLVFKGWLRLPSGVKRAHGGWWRFDESRGRFRYLSDLGKYLDRSHVLNFVGQGRVEMTFTAVPAGLGRRLGVDRDEDEILDFVEVRTWGTNPASCDTDGDGFDDWLEINVGTSPTLFHTGIEDTHAPVIDPVSVEAQDVFSDSATLTFLFNEPAEATVQTGPAPGSYDASFTESALQRRHEMILSGLPAGVTVYYRVTGADHRGNVAQPVTGSFTTAPPLFHVESLGLQASGNGPYSLQATALIQNQAGNPIAGVEVTGFWHSSTGDLGGLTARATATTNGAGLAVFNLGPLDPVAENRVTFTVGFVGSLDPGNPYFVGAGGDWPSFFYFQPDNKANYAVVTLQP